MAYKEFDYDLFLVNDLPGRVAVSTFMWREWGIKAVENPDRYGVDLIATRNGKPVGCVEVEVRSWCPCPYPTIHIASRKKKLLDNDLPTLFFAVTSDLENAYWCDAKTILDAPLIEAPNMYVSKNEFFYDVPVDNFNYVSLYGDDYE